MSTPQPDPSQPSIGAVRDNQRLDEAALNAWFRAHVANPAEPLVLSQFNRGASNPTYLITAGEDGRPHTVMVDAVLRDNVFHIGEVGSHTTRNLDVHTIVSLLWPPREPGGYALMVDGRAESGDQLRVVPVKALLHRRAAPGSPAAESGCLHDCVVFKA